jgi:hypothetical protein
MWESRSITGVPFQLITILHLLEPGRPGQGVARL